MKYLFCYLNKNRKKVLMKFSNDATWTSYSKKKKEKYHSQNVCNSKASILMNNCEVRSPHNRKKKKKEKKIASAMEVFKEELIATPPTKIKW